MGRSRPRERHIFPPDNDPPHKALPWCPCRPSKRANGSGAVYVHHAPGDRPEQAPPAGPHRR